MNKELTLPQGMQEFGIRLDEEMDGDGLSEDDDVASDDDLAEDELFQAVFGAD